MGRVGVYILQCNNSRYYIGSTDDLVRRLKEHSEGKSKFTRHLLPIKLRAFIECHELKEARKLEYEVKKKKSRKFVEGLIEKYPVD